VALAKPQPGGYLLRIDKRMDRARILVADKDARAETETRQQRLGRITFRAWRRGFREADLVLGPFMEREGLALSEADLDSLEALLAEDNDHELYAWIIETKPTPAEHATPLMKRLRRFMRAHVAAAVAEGAG
jgi:antitoxin CptB